MELNCEGLEMGKWNIPTNRARRVDEENRAIFLVIMFTLGVMVIKLLRNGSIFVYFPDDSKTLVTI